MLRESLCLRYTHDVWLQIEVRGGTPMGIRCRVPWARRAAGMQRLPVPCRLSGHELDELDRVLPTAHRHATTSPSSFAGPLGITSDDAMHWSCRRLLPDQAQDTHTFQVLGHMRRGTESPCSAHNGDRSYWWSRLPSNVSVDRMRTNPLSRSLRTQRLGRLVWT